MAMWDIKGKEIGRPIYELFGGPTFEDKIPVYCHVPGGSSPTEFAGVGGEVSSVQGKDLPMNM